MPAKKNGKNKKTTAAAAAPAKEAQKMTIIEPGMSAKKVAAKGTAAKKGKKVTMQSRLRKLFVARPKQWTLGVAVPHKRNMTHFVRWPRYIRVQRQKTILQKRLKTPPPIHMFDKSLDKATAVSLFKLLDKMRPEEEAARKARRLAGAKRLAETVPKVQSGKPTEEQTKAARAARAEILKDLAAKRPMTAKFGLNHVTNLVLKNKAQLVVIASDVDPLEVVLWLPALCRKKKVPFCIVRNKARLGRLVHQKTATCVAITDVPKELRADFDKLVQAIKPQFLENTSMLREWGEPKLGLKHLQREAKRLRHLKKAESKKNTKA